MRWCAACAGCGQLHRSVSRLRLGRHLHQPALLQLLGDSASEGQLGPGGREHEHGLQDVLQQLRVVARGRRVAQDCEAREGRLLRQGAEHKGARLLLADEGVRVRLAERAHHVGQDGGGRVCAPELDQLGRGGAEARQVEGDLKGLVHGRGLDLGVGKLPQEALSLLARAVLRQLDHLRVYVAHRNVGARCSSSEKRVRQRLPPRRRRRSRGGRRRGTFRRSLHDKLCLRAPLRCANIEGSSNRAR